MSPHQTTFDYNIAFPFLSCQQAFPVTTVVFAGTAMAYKLPSTRNQVHTPTMTFLSVVHCESKKKSNKKLYSQSVFFTYEKQDSA